MIRTFVDALSQRLGQSIMRKTKQSVKVHIKLLTLLLLLLTVGIGNVWGAPTSTHTPGTYTSSNGYNQTLVTVDGREYEIYGFASTNSSANHVWAGTTTTTSTDKNYVLSFATTTEATKDWISNYVNGRGSSYSNLSEEGSKGTEFYGMGLSGSFQMNYRNNSKLTIKISGYDQFSFFGKDNGTTKNFMVTIDGVLQDMTVSTKASVRRFDISTGEHTIEVSANTTSNCVMWGFSLRIPQISSSCTAPTSVVVTPTNEFGWRYSIGETISLTATPTGGSGNYTYQWQKYIGDTWTDIAGATAATYTKTNCTTGDGGSYRCVVSTGNDCSYESEGYFVRVFTLNGGYTTDGEWTAHKIDWTDENTGVVTISLPVSKTYYFKVTDNDGKWFGYGDASNYIIQPWQADCGTGNSNIRLFTGPAGDYKFTINIEHAQENSPYVNIKVDYPEVTHPVEGYAYINKWWDCYVHYWEGASTALTEWGSDPKINDDRYVNICGTDYWYFPVIETYTNFIAKDNAGNPENTTGDQSTTNHSGQNITHNGSAWVWQEFSTYSITFNANGGTGSMTNVTGITCGGSATLTQNAFTRTGYNFAGWATTADGAVAHADKATISNITSDITLYAKWNAETYSITYSGLEGATHSNPATYTIETETITFTNPSERTGYTFAGWNPASIAKGSTGNKTVTATWTANTYTVTFNANGGTGTMDPQTVEHNVPEALNANTFTPPTGLSFAGWNTAPDGTGTSYTNSQSVTLTADLTLYAQWAEEPECGAETVLKYVWKSEGTFCDGATPSEIAMIEENDYFALTGNHEQKSGGSLNLGNTSGNYFLLTAKSGYRIQSVCFFGKIEDASVNYTTDGNDWTKTITSTSTSSNKTYTIETNASNYFGIKLNNTKGIWIRNMIVTMCSTSTSPDPTDYTLTYDQNQPSAWNAQFAIKNIPAEQTLTGGTGNVSNNTPVITDGAESDYWIYEFNGWNTAADGSGTSYAAGAEITIAANTTLYAQWTPRTFNITYYDTDRTTTLTGLTPTSYTYGTGATLPTPTKADYTFTGWILFWNGGESAKTEVNTGDWGDVQLAAQWTENTPEPTTYTVTVTPPTNGTISASKTTGINEGEAITLTVTPASGYQLETLTVKDASDNTVTVTDNKFTMPASNVTVSATFTEISTGGECITLTHFATSQHQTTSPRLCYAYEGSMGGTSYVIQSDDSNNKGVDSGSAIRLNQGNKYINVLANTATSEFSNVSKIAFKWKFHGSTSDYTTTIDVYVGEVKVAADISLTGNKNDNYELKEISVSPIQSGSVKFVNKGTGDSKFSIYVDDIEICTAPDCTAPATPLDVSVDNNEITVGGTTTITTTGGNGSAVTLTANGGTIEGNTYTAPATQGTYTITAIQPKNGEQCAGEATCTITVKDLPNAPVYDLALNKDNVCAEENATLTLSGSQSGVNYQLYKDGVASGAPVAGTGNALTWTVTETATYTVKSVANATYKETTMNGTPKLTVTNTPTITITGQGAVTQGEAVTLTATAAGATSFEWFRVDSETTTGGTSVANTATYTPNTNTEGTYYYYCVASNSCGSAKLCVAVVVKAPDGTCGTIPSTGATVTLTNGVILHSANSDGRQVDNDYIKEQDVTGDSDKERTYNSGRYVLKMPADVERLIVYAYREGTARDLKGVKISPTFGPNAEDVAYVNADCSYETSGSQPNYIYEITFNTPVTVGQYVFLNFSDAMYFWQICYVSSCEDLVPTVTPRAAVLCEDGAVTLTATNYTADATLQWYKDGVEITGATTDTYTASEAGVYTFGANKTCERTSNEVAVVAAQTPVIETQPTNASTAAGVTNSDIFVKATGATSYQWYACDEDGSNPVIMPGQTAATLNVTPELPGTYYYKVVVIGGCDLSVTSTVASLEVVDGACFSMVMKAKSTTLSNDAEVTKDMADITGGTVVSDGNSMNIKQYSVPNTSTYISEIELKNYLKVTLASGSIGKGTVIRVKYRNGSSGSGRGVQILKTDKTVIHSFTNNTSTLTEETYEVTADMDVSEFYIGRATSNATYLSEVEILGCVTPCEKPVITTQPVGNNYCNDTEWNNRESLSVTVEPVTDGGTLSYQWYKDSEEIDGATSTTYIPSASGQYYCIVTNTLGGNTASTTSNEVTVFNQRQDVTLTWNFKTGNRPNATQNSTTSLITNLTDITATGVNVSSDAKQDRTVKFGTVADASNETDGATFSFDVEELYDFTPSTISMKVATVSTTFPIRVTIKDEIGQTITGTVTPTAADTETAVNFTMPIVKWMGKVTVLVQGNADGAEFRLFGDVTISGAVECGCTPPVMAWKQGETEVTEITVGYTAANFYEFPTLTKPAELEVTYASTDENVATVDAMGVVTPINNGTTVISAKYVGDAVNKICPVTVTYVLTIVCDDDQPMITTSVTNPLDCNDVIPLQLVASDGVTPISSGFVQWYRNGVAIQDATEYTYEAGRAGTYTATLQINCLQTTSNSAVITNKQTEPTVTKLVSQQKIRNNGLENGQRPYSSELKYSLFEVTPTNTQDYTGAKWKATAMIHYQNGDLENLGEVTWMREDATTATSITLGANFYEVSQVVLNKSLQKGDAIYVTVAPANACDEIDKFIMDSIPILVTDKYSLAYIITGTVDGGFFDVDAEPLADPVFTLLQDYYDVTAVNGYATFSLNNYAPFDLVLLTDYPKTKIDKVAVKAVEDLSALVDEKPMLSLKAHMSGVAGWTEKGFLGNPVVPGLPTSESANTKEDAQTHLHVLCYAHDMFQGVGLTDINGDGVAEELQILTDVANDKDEESKPDRWKGMQGFTASDASNFVNIATVHNGAETSTEQLIACCERQEVVDARFMMLSINNLSTKFIGGDGTKVIANILEYLLHSDPTAVSDCSLVFDDNNGSGVWSDPLNWAPSYNMVPGRYHNVRIDRPCKVDQLAAVALVKVRKDMETTANGQKGYWQGSLTVQPGKKLTVFGNFGKVQGKNFLEITPLQGNYNDLVIETDADEAGAFAIDPDANSQANAPDATIKFYSQGTGAVAGSEDPSQALWHYMAIPTTGVQMAVTPFSGAWVCRWDEEVPNASNYPQAHWYVVNEEDKLMPFEGYALTQANPTTYTIKGRINVGNPTINTLTYTPVTGDNTGDRTDEQSRTYPKAYPGFNLLGNSYTAPIKLSAIPESAFSTNLQKTIYIYNAGTWAQWYGDGTMGSVVPEDGTSKNPGQYLALPLNANLGDGALKWIPAMQGFFVRVIGDGSATISGEKIDIDYLNMVVQPNYDDLETPPVPRAPQKPGRQKVDPNQSLMKMTVKGKRFADNLYLLIQDECTHEFDNGWDGDKIYGNARTPQLFAIEKYGPMAVNTVDDINGQSIGFFAGEDSEYTITYDPTEMREHYTQLYLHDMTTGAVTDMFAQNEYTFSVGKQGEVRRFVISTSPDPHWDTSDAGLLRAWAVDELLYVENFTDSEGDYTVFDAAGRKIAYGHLPALGRYSFQLKLIPGAYTVNVRTNSIVKPVKVIF